MIIDIQEVLTVAAKRGMDDKAICAATGVNNTTLWRWRKGEMAPRLTPELTAFIKKLNAKTAQCRGKK